MLNTSVIDIHFTSVPFSFNKVCLKSVYVGMVVAYVAMSLCFILGTPAHSWLLWLYLRAGQKIKPTQVFLLNLTLLELIYSLQCGFQMLSLPVFNSDTVISVITFIFGVSCVSRPLMQVCICVEQYLAVLHPIIFLKYKALQYRIVCTALTWFIAAGYGVYMEFTYSYPNNVFNTIFIISVIIISFCCVSVLLALKHPGPGDTQIPVERGREVGNQQKRNAFNTIFSGLLIILITYLPVTSLGLINLVPMEKKLFNCDIVPVMHSFGIFGMITPLLKLNKNGDIKCLKHQREMKQNS